MRREGEREGWREEGRRERGDFICMNSMFIAY